MAPDDVWSKRYRTCAPRSADAHGRPGRGLHPGALGLHGALPARRGADDHADLPRLARLAAGRARRRRGGRLAPPARAVHAHEGDGALLGRAGVLVLAAGADLLPAHDEHRRAAAQVDGVRVLLGGAGGRRRVPAGRPAPVPAARRAAAAGSRPHVPPGDALPDRGRRAAVRLHAGGLRDRRAAAAGVRLAAAHRAVEERVARAGDLAPARGLLPPGARPRAGAAARAHRPRGGARQPGRAHGGRPHPRASRSPSPSAASR